MHKLHYSVLTNNTKSQWLRTTNIYQVKFSVAVLHGLAQHSRHHYINLCIPQLLCEKRELLECLMPANKGPSLEVQASFLPTFPWPKLFIWLTLSAEVWVIFPLSKKEKEKNVSMNSLTIRYSNKKSSTKGPIYRRPFCMAWAQLPLRKASGE